MTTTFKIDFHYSLQACAGLFSSFARIISSVATGDVILSALLYFLSAVVVIVICLASLFFLLKLVSKLCTYLCKPYATFPSIPLHCFSFYLFYFPVPSPSTHSQPFVKYYLDLTTVRALKFRQEDSKRRQLDVIYLNYNVFIAIKSVNEKRPARLPFCSILKAVSFLPYFSIYLLSSYHVAQISVYALSVCLVFSLTISLFPAICSSIKSSVKNPDHTIWTGTFVLLIFLLLYDCTF